MDWELLQTFVVQGNTQQFLKQVADSLQTGNKQFGILQKGLQTHCFKQVGTSWISSVYGNVCVPK